MFSGKALPAFRLMSSSELLRGRRGLLLALVVVELGLLLGLLGVLAARAGGEDGEFAAIETLLAEGDLPSGSDASPVFDDEFLAGLARFQVRNGLRVSGFVDSRTLAILGTTAADRLRQLESNLTRIQELMSINKAPRYVLVNVPAFVAQAVENGNLALQSNVIAGKPARATPQVSAKIVEINFFPTWSVPEIVAQQDLIPKIRKDPTYFSEEHFTVMTDWKSAPLARLLPPEKDRRLVFYCASPS